LVVAPPAEAEPPRKMKSPTEIASPMDCEAMVSEVAAEPVSTKAWGAVYWFCVAPEPGVPIQIFAVVFGVWSMLPDTPPVAIDPVLIVVCAVAAAEMAVRTQPQQFPNSPLRMACSEYWANGIIIAWRSSAALATFSSLGSR